MCNAELGCHQSKAQLEYPPTVRDMLKPRSLILDAREPQAGTKDTSSGPQITIMVVGASPRTILLRVDLSWTVSQVVAALRRRRAIAPLERVRQYLIFPPHSPAPLHPQDQLLGIGVQELSTLHVRTCVMGGSARKKGMLASLSRD